jgi:hypothetical protein
MTKSELKKQYLRLAEDYDVLKDEDLEEMTNQSLRALAESSREEQIRFLEEHVDSDDLFNDYIEEILPPRETESQKRKFIRDGMENPTILDQLVEVCEEAQYQEMSSLPVPDLFERLRDRIGPTRENEIRKSEIERAAEDFDPDFFGDLNPEEFFEKAYEILGPALIEERIAETRTDHEIPEEALSDDVGSDEALLRSLIRKHGREKARRMIESL